MSHNLLPQNVSSEMPAPVKAARTWSKYQTAIFDAIVDGTGNGVIEAVAGSGKTTTMVEALVRWKALHHVLPAIFVAFNKSIATELQAKVPNGVDAATLHSVCCKAIYRAFKGIRVDDRKLHDYVREVIEDHSEYSFKNIHEKDTAYNISEDLTRIYGLLKGTMTDLADADKVDEVIAAYALTLKVPALSIPLLPKLDETMRADTTRMTFDEMLSFIIDHGLSLNYRYDLVCVDEAQDMNLLQIAILKKLVKPNGRLWAVGDTYQSIYAFRGADQQAMNRIRTEFAVPSENELPLSITYRCPQSVVKEAQEYVEHIQASENAPIGAVVKSAGRELLAVLMNMVPGQSMGICRGNAALVGCALHLIKNGRKATVRGRDIGKGLQKLVRDLSRKHNGTVVGLMEAIEAHRNRETIRFAAKKQNNQIQMLNDKCDTILVLLDNVEEVSELDGAIEAIFSDAQTEGVSFSSIHKAKGLEADTVVWLNPGLSEFIANKCIEKGDISGAQQEENLSYVAITRAKKTLIFQPIPRPGDDGGDE
jgi:DNA helicase-2/ATP-dependent DNA helicase PcrA